MLSKNYSMQYAVYVTIKIVNESGSGGVYTEPLGCVR